MCVCVCVCVCVSGKWFTFPADLDHSNKSSLIDILQQCQSGVCVCFFLFFSGRKESLLDILQQGQSRM